MNRYKITIFKQFNLIPETFIIESTRYLEDMREKITANLDGNALCFTDIKNKVRFYDRGIVAKIFVKQV